MKLGMISLGCAKNLIDSEMFLGVATKYGIEITTNIDEEDLSDLEDDLLEDLDDEEEDIDF